MSNSTAVLPKSLIIFGICVPVALMVGYLLATPTEVMSFGVVGIVSIVLCLPLLLHWHHAALIFAWNVNLSIFFLPGQPALWILLAGMSLGFSVLARLMNKKACFQNVPSITWPLAFLMIVIVLTAKLTGGIGLNSLGSETYGGKKFFYVLAAIIGYYAISCQRIPVEKAHRYSRLFFLSGLTAAISNLIYFAGPAFYYLFLFFPVDNALAQALEDFSGAEGVRFGRVLGVAVAAMAAFYYLLSRNGLRGMLDLTKPWRLIFAVLCFALSLLGGFRSAVVIFGLLCVAQFYFEGLFRTKLVFPLIASITLLGASLMLFATKLPLSVQRSLSILPIEIDQSARHDAKATLDWRLDMWKMMVPQVREYFWLGKGYALNPSDLYLMEESVRRGLAKNYEANIVNGDYHSGPLSVMIPFGVFGLGGFVWLLVAGLRLLYRNRRFGDPVLYNLNTFLLSYFLARTVFYFVGFGSFSSDLPLFLGILGFSVALNGRVSDRKQEKETSEPVQSGLLLAAGAR